MKEVESEKDGHAQGHFLAGCRRQTEDNADENAHQASGNDQVHGVVERFAAHLNQEDHFDVVGRRARAIRTVVNEFTWNLQTRSERHRRDRRRMKWRLAYTGHIPRATFEIIVFERLIAGHTVRLLRQQVRQVAFVVADFVILREDDLARIVRPRCKTHLALLRIEREILDVDATRRFVDGWRHPVHFARVHENYFGLECHFVVAIYGVMQRRVAVDGANLSLPALLKRTTS